MVKERIRKILFFFNLSLQLNISFIDKLIEGKL